MIVNVPLNLINGIYAVPYPRTVLHELATGEPAQIMIGNRLVDIPKPDLPVKEIMVDGVRMKVLLVGPPWSLFNDYLVASDQERQNVVKRIEAWLMAAARRKLLQASVMVMPGVMSYAIGMPIVPQGEVWIGMRGLNVHPASEGFAIRWPIASSNPLKCTIKLVRDRYGIFVNDHDLVVGRQGDSDGDLLFVVWTGGKPAEYVDMELSLDRIVELSDVEIPDSVEQVDPQSLANGHAAKSLVGIATWWTWVHARYDYDRYGDIAWAEAYDRYTPAIEAMMDGRKTGESVSLSQFGFGKDLPNLVTLINMALPGVRQMVATRSRAVDFNHNWRRLIRDYWSLRWAPEGVDL